MIQTFVQVWAPSETNLAHHTNYDAWTADAYKLQPPKIAKNSPILHKNCAEGLVGMTWAQDQVDSFTISFQWTKFEGKCRLNSSHSPAGELEMRKNLSKDFKGATRMALMRALK